MSPAPSKPPQMACVSIGYRNILMPADKAMKVVELLQYAVAVDRSYRDSDDLYVVSEEPLHVSLEFVPTGKIRMPAGKGASAAQRWLT